MSESLASHKFVFSNTTNSDADCFMTGAENFTERYSYHLISHLYQTSLETYANVLQGHFDIFPENLLQVRHNKNIGNDASAACPERN